MKRDDFDFRAFFEGFRPELQLDIGDKLIADLFAGAGGISTGIEWALGRAPHIAINHSADALSMHQANHPQTHHFIADVFEICPKEATQGRPVGLLHCSPDCRHFSQAAGGQPRSSKIRSLAWIAYRWAGQVRPDIISIENVVPILKWSPLIAKRDKETGRVVKLDGTVAAPGEQVARRDQFLVPDPKRLGKTWRQFVQALRSLGYVVDWKVGCAADYGAPTTRERLFMVARCDGRPIQWPAPTHFKDPAPGEMKWRGAAEAIDFSLDCPSIFDRELRGKKSLAVNTLRRVGRGTKRCVIDAPSPFIVPLAHHRADSLNDQPTARSVQSLRYQQICRYSSSLIRAMLARRQGSTSIRAAGMVVKFRFDGTGTPLDRPLPVITAGGNGKGRPAGAAHALGLSTVFLAQMNGGFNDVRGVPGHDVRRPMTSMTQKGSQQQVIQQDLVRLRRGFGAHVSSAHVLHLRRHCDARPMGEPIRTISAEGQHHGVIESMLERLPPTSSGLSAEHEAKALRVARFMLEYCDLGISQDEAATMSTEQLLALVTVQVDGVPHVIVDIGLRMLEPVEIFRAQGFPRNYKISHGHDGRVFTKEKQTRMCGNSVSPHHGAAVIAANCAHLRAFSEDDLRRLAERKVA